MSDSIDSYRILQTNLGQIGGSIEAAARRAGRDPSDVRMVSVTKKVGVGIINGLIRLGVTDLGENRLQAAAPKIESIPAGPCWHLIGHLQGNKVRAAISMFSWIHSVDSLRLFERIDRVAAELGLRPRVLFQVNVSGEEAKFGLTESELDKLVDRAASAKAAVPEGLMTMAPFADDPEDSRPWFRRLRELLEDLRQNGRVDGSFRHLSMGMTNDYEVAVEEGATLVRVGTALYEGIDNENG